MRAMILAAGLGTRLRPLTDSTPKPLVKLGGRPMISYVLDLLYGYGFHEILINVHYLSEQISHFASVENKKHNRRRLFIQDETGKILGSGGAIGKARGWLFEHETTALVCNADSLMRPNLKELCATHAELHAKRGVELTLAVMPHPDAGRKYTGLRCADNLVQEFVPISKENMGTFFHFPGVYIIEQSAAQLLPSDQDSSIFENLWVPLAQKKKLGAWEYNGIYQDLGSMLDLAAAEKIVASGALSNQGR